MYVKSLTLRGFKSFASATSLRFEPGITCVVGPNGSGKSNIVDAFAWVMGEQGAKSLRGGKMDDVVFAGTASRPPLGRAEVTLTIDNTDGALPIDYTEVTISRLLFRSGQSEYAINGNQCRLLDVTELLSDSGLGREMHVIVGQGQLDEVLHAGPEARRALIEEAAGVLKHRRRKEKALRKLEAMQVNLTRLVDLTGELRRRLGPLGRQAAIARRAATIQADLRDAKLRLLADDFAGAAAALERGEANEAAALARRAELENLLAQARRQESALDADELQHAPRLEAALNTWFELSSLAERLRGVANLARERHALLAADQAPARPGRDPGELDAEAAALREQEAVLGEALEAARAASARPPRAAPSQRRTWPRPNGCSPTRPAPPRPAPTSWPGCAARWGPPAAASRPARRRRPGLRTPSSRPGPVPGSPSGSTKRHRNWRVPGPTTGPAWPRRTRRRPPPSPEAPPASPSAALPSGWPAPSAPPWSPAARRWKRACVPSRTARPPRRPCWRTRSGPGMSSAGSLPC